MPKWIPANAPPATQNQFFLSQLWFLIFSVLVVHTNVFRRGGAAQDLEQQLQLLLGFGLSLSTLLGQRRKRRKRWRGRGDVRHDARLGNILLPALLQQWIGFDRVPTPVNQAKARAHNKQHFIVMPKTPELTHVFSFLIQVATILGPDDGGLGSLITVLTKNITRKMSPFKVNVLMHCHVVLIITIAYNLSILITVLVLGRFPY